MKEDNDHLMAFFHNDCFVVHDVIHQSRFVFDFSSCFIFNVLYSVGKEWIIRIDILTTLLFIFFFLSFCKQRRTVHHPKFCGSCCMVVIPFPVQDMNILMTVNARCSRVCRRNENGVTKGVNLGGPCHEHYEY